MAQDWKDILASLAGNADQAESDTQQASGEIVSEKKKRQLKPLNVIVDKKGRKGKIATIIEGFEHDDEVEEIASELKRKIGTGGSYRGGEILLQGEWREKVIKMLKEKGYAAR